VDVCDFISPYPAIKFAADYNLSCPPEEGNIWGKLNKHYMPKYIDAIIEKLIKARF
jgi:hypothetical protein